MITNTGVFSCLKVKIYARVLEGYVNILTNGGDGNKGQNGADGRKGPDSLDKVWKVLYCFHSSA